jgi:autotransporter-associated beta strand protein
MRPKTTGANCFVLANAGRWHEFRSPRMKLGYPTFALVAALSVPALRAQFVWTGAGSNGLVTNPQNWQGGVAPSGDGTEDVTFGDIPSVLQNVQIPSTGFEVHNVTFQGTDRPAYDFQGGSPAPSFVLTGDLSVSAHDSSTDIVLDNTLNVALTGGSHTISTGDASVFAYGQIGQIDGTASLVKNGSGTLILDAANSFTGNLTVNQGLLSLSGSLTNTSATVNGGSIELLGGANLPGTLTFSNGTISGLGTVAGSATVGVLRTVAPFYTEGGDIASTLTFNSGLTFGSGGTYDWLLTDATGTAGDGWGLLSINGNLLINVPSTPFTLHITGMPVNFNNTLPYSWVVASATGGITGFDARAFSIDPSSFDASLGSGTFFLSQSGNDLLLNFTPVPEPSTWALMLVGLGILFVSGWRRARRDPDILPYN